MISGLHFSLTGEPPVPPPDADFRIKIDFKKGEGNPRRVFDAASLLIAGFEQLDAAAAATIDARIEPFLVLEDVRASSIRIFLKNLLKATDDQALKELDWKPAVGKYLVRAKYVALKWLDGPHDGGPPKLPNLVDELRQIAKETDVRHLPDYPPVHEARLIGALEKLQDAKRQLSKNDRLYIETETETYQVDLARTWSPSQSLTEKELSDPSRLRFRRSVMIRWRPRCPGLRSPGANIGAMACATQAMSPIGNGC